jgi:hypothetical protein
MSRLQAAPSSTPPLTFAAMRATPANLKKLEDILGDADYTVRYERGNFQSGYCILEQKRVVVLNKFLQLEGRINTLLELIPTIAIDYDKLTLESQKLYQQVVDLFNQKPLAATEGNK